MNVEAECNWEKLKDRLKDIENTILGLKTPVSKLVCDENGLATDEKVQKLAEEVVSHQCYLNGRYIGIQGADKRYYELLFYLIFRAYDPDDTILCFADFMEVVAELKRVCKSREELILRDAELIGRPLGFFEMIWESCKLLTGNSLADDMTEEQLKQLQEEYVQKESAYEQKNIERRNVFELDYYTKENIRERYEDYGIEGYDEYWDAYDDEYWYKYDYLVAGEDMVDLEASEEDVELSGTWSRRQRRFLTVEEEQNRQIRKEQWIHSFKDPEKYLNAYREFSVLHFCVDVLHGKPNLEEAILYILEYKGFNKIRDDEKFVSLYAELNRALRMARRKF